MQCWVACFDIEDDTVRRNVGKRLLRHGKRVQRSVFELLINNRAELDQLRTELDHLIGDTGDLRLYPLCRHCRVRSMNQSGDSAIRFPRVQIL